MWDIIKKVSVYAVTIAMMASLFSAFMPTSQNAEAGYRGQEVGRAITNDGAFTYATGSTNSYGADDAPGYQSTGPRSINVFIEKRLIDNVNHLTSLIWRVYWGGGGLDEGFAIARSGDYLYVTGYGSDPAKPFGNEVGDAIILKYDLNGNLVWAVQWDKNGGDEEGTSIAVTADAIYVCGDIGYHQGFIIKYNLNGVKQWEDVWSVPDSDVDYVFLAIDNTNSKIYVTYSVDTGEVRVRRYCYDKTQDWDTALNEGQFPQSIAVSGSNIYIAGYEFADAWVAKYDLSASNVWSKTWDNNGKDYDIAHSVAVTANNVFVCGKIDMDDDDAKRNWDAFILKYGLDGGLLSTKTIDYSDASGTTDECAYSISVSGSYLYIFGETHRSGTQYDTIYEKYDLNLVKKAGGRAWGGSTWDCAYSTIYYNNNIYLAGGTESYGMGGKDALIMKYDLAGNLVWFHTWGGSKHDCALSIAVYVWGQNQACLYITGYTSSFGAGGKDIFYLCVSPDGSVLSYTTWGGPTDDVGYSIAISGIFTYIAGSTSNQGGANTDGVILKYSNGIVQQTALWGGAAFDCIQAIYATDSIFVCGQTFSLGNGNADMFVAKYDTNLVLKWQATDGAQGFDCGYSLVASGGFVYIAGCRSQGTQLNMDAYMWKYQDNGNNGAKVATDSYGGQLEDCARSIILQGGSLYITGYTYSFGTGGSCDIFILKDTPNLVRLQTRVECIHNNNWNQPALGDDFGFGICADAANLYVGGWTLPPAPLNHGAFVAKYQFNLQQPQVWEDRFW